MGIKLIKYQVDGWMITMNKLCIDRQLYIYLEVPLKDY